MIRSDVLLTGRMRWRDAWSIPSDPSAIGFAVMPLFAASFRFFATTTTSQFEGQQSAGYHSRGAGSPLVISKANRRNRAAWTTGQGPIPTPLFTHARERDCPHFDCADCPLFVTVPFSDCPHFAFRISDEETCDL